MHGTQFGAITSARYWSRLILLVLALLAPAAVYAAEADALTPEALFAYSSDFKYDLFRLNPANQAALLHYAKVGQDKGVGKRMWNLVSELSEYYWTIEQHEKIIAGKEFSPLLSTTNYLEGLGESIDRRIATNFAAQGKAMDARLLASDNYKKYLQAEELNAQCVKNLNEEQYEAALTACNKALTLAKSTRYRENLARIYVRLSSKKSQANQYQEAVILAEKAVEYAPNQAFTHQKLAAAYYRLSNTVKGKAKVTYREHAKTHYLTAFRIDPKLDPSDLMALCSAQEREDLLTQYPTHTALRVAYGQALIWDGQDVKQAWHAFFEAVQSEREKSTGAKKSVQTIYQEWRQKLVKGYSPFVAETLAHYSPLQLTKAKAKEVEDLWQGKLLTGIRRCDAIYQAEQKNVPALKCLVSGYEAQDQYTQALVYQNQYIALLDRQKDELAYYWAIVTRVGILDRLEKCDLAKADANLINKWSAGMKTAPVKPRFDLESVERIQVLASLSLDKCGVLSALAKNQKTVEEIIQELAK